MDAQKQDLDIEAVSDMQDTPIYSTPSSESLAQNQDSPDSASAPASASASTSTLTTTSSSSTTPATTTTISLSHFIHLTFPFPTITPLTHELNRSLALGYLPPDGADTCACGTTSVHLKGFKWCSSCNCREKECVCLFLGFPFLMQLHYVEGCWACDGAFAAEMGAWGPEAPTGGQAAAERASIVAVREEIIREGEL